MVVRVDQGGKKERARPGRGRRSFGDRGDDAVLVPQYGIFDEAAVRAGEQAVGGYFHRCTSLSVICEEQSDDLSAVAQRAKAEAIHLSPGGSMDCFAALAMTWLVRRVLQFTLGARRQEFA
jgi:hypothetical protein